MTKMNEHSQWKIKVGNMVNDLTAGLVLINCVCSKRGVKPSSAFVTLVSGLSSPASPSGTCF